MISAVTTVPTPWTPLARGLFSDLLAAGPGLVTVWEGLDQQGIIERWLPEWTAVRSRPQRNAVHRHTVDRHLIETVVHATGLLRGVGRADLLLLAALLVVLAVVVPLLIARFRPPALLEHHDQEVS